jgi:hypothetical protein
MNDYDSYYHYFGTGKYVGETGLVEGGRTASQLVRELLVELFHLAVRPRQFDAETAQRK